MTSTTRICWSILPPPTPSFRTVLMAEEACWSIGQSGTDYLGTYLHIMLIVLHQYLALRITCLCSYQPRSIYRHKETFILFPLFNQAINLNISTRSHPVCSPPTPPAPLSQTPPHDSLTRNQHPPPPILAQWANPARRPA